MVDMKSLLTMQGMMFLMILIGAGMRKIQIVTTEGRRSMTNLVVNLILPSNILYAFSKADASAFRSMLPMTVVMNDLNSNEKYGNLSSELPVNARRPGTIRAGDLMLFGLDCIVLFYKSFSTSYSYTSIGRIADVTGLSEALGGGRVTVTFEMPEE